MKFKKKPISIEAVRFAYTAEGIATLEEFLGDSLGDIRKTREMNSLAEAQIFTLEDGNYFKVKHIATEGDYIIKGINGEFYPCKPDIFEKTYEKVEE